MVYSRQLQTRALRKLGMILRRVRQGQQSEDNAMKEFGVVTAPAPFIPAGAARTPVGTSQQAFMSQPVEQGVAQASVVKDALGNCN